MIILKTRSEVKVTVTAKWYTTLRHPKMHPHIKFGIPPSKNLGDMHRTRSWTDRHFITIQTKSEVKVTVTRKWYATLRYPKMHPHTKFGIPTSKNIGDMHLTRSGRDGRTDSAITICLPKFLWGHKKYFRWFHTPSWNIWCKMFFNILWFDTGRF